MNRKAIILGLTIVFVSNGILLLRVAAERSGTPAQTLQLTERELPMVPRGQEDSSVSLRLAWRSSFMWSRNARPPMEKDVTFDEEKLRVLGFRCGTPDSKSPFYRIPQHRLAYVVLERSEESAAAAPNEPVSSVIPAQSVPQPAPDRLPSHAPSTLVVADASGSLDELRTRYPDAQKFLIVRGVIGVSPLYDKASAKESRWIGRVSELLPGEIHVPLPYAGELNRLAGEKGSLSRYTVTLHYGPRLEPWIGSISARP